MKTLFVMTIFLAQTALAQGLPKSAKVLLQLNLPTVSVQFPTLNLEQASLNKSAGVLKFSETGSINVGGAVYKMDPSAIIALKDESLPLSVSNLKWIRYRLFSTELDRIAASILVDMTTGDVSVSPTGQGIITEWF